MQRSSSSSGKPASSGGAAAKKKAATTAAAPAPATSKSASKTMSKTTTTTTKTVSKTTTARSTAAAKTAKTGAKTSRPGAAKAAPGAKKKAAAKPKKPAETPEQRSERLAAVTIQRVYRGHAARAELERRRREEAERVAAMEKQMEELRVQAWRAQLEYDRKQEAKARKRAEEERKRRKEEERLRKLMLDAAFDGETEEVVQLIEAGANVNVADVHGNTLMSEAAAGGHPDVIRVLAAKGAEPNTCGEFGRSPLWRAAFLGKSDAIMALLECGADPRVGNAEGELPADAASTPEIAAVIRGWDLEQTDVLLQSLEDRRQREAEERAAAAATELRTGEANVEEAAAHNQVMQRALMHAHGELEKRIREYDTCVGEGKSAELIEVAEQQIKAAEATLGEAQRKARQASDDLAMAKLALRDTQQSQAGGEEVTTPAVGITVDIRELDDILFKDVGKRLEADGRAPFVIDKSGRSSVFLQYADTNLCSALSREHTSPNRLRRSILGAIRYGKPFVMDLMDCASIWERVGSLLDEVLPGLLALLTSGDLLRGERYLELARKEDGEEYEKNRFQEERVRKFRFIVVTSADTWEDEFLAGFYTINVKVDQG